MTDTKPRRRSFITILAPIVIIVLGAGGVLVAMKSFAPQPEQTEQVVRGLAVFVERAEPGAAQLTVKTQGEVRPRREIDLIPQVSGRVVEVSEAFIEGGFFDEGEMLLKIEDADYRLAATRMEAEVARASRALEAELAEAAIARRDWEDLGEGQATALALREPQVAEARAALAAAEAQLEDARLQLGRTEIRAPFAGRVRSKAVDLGQYVSPGQQLGRIFSTDVVEIRLPLADSELALLGLPVAFYADEAHPGLEVGLQATVAGQPRHWTGQIVRTDSAIDAQTRTLYAFAEVEDPYGAAMDGDAPLAVGLFVTAEIMGRELDNVVTLPRAALRSADQVLVANTDGTLGIRTAEIVTSDREKVVFASGVDAGDYVIISPVLGPVEGMAIEAFSPEGELLFPERAEEDAVGGSDEDSAATDDEAIASANGAGERT